MPKKIIAVEEALSKDDQIRKRVIEGARRCFNKHGVHKITIEDIAKASKIARSGIYRYFATRQEIVEAALIARLSELIDSYLTMTGAASNFAEMLIIGSLATVDAGRNDTELHQMIDPQQGDIHFNDLLAGTSPIARYMTLHFWKPIFDYGRRSGEMRDDISIEEAIEWLRGVILMFTVRRYLDTKHERNLLEKFLLHSMLTPAALEAWVTSRVPRKKAKK